MSSKMAPATRKNGGMPALTPLLRFPEFRDKASWEPTTIGALGRFYYGKSAPKWSLAKDAPTPCVRYGELYTKFGPIITEIYSRTNTDPKTLRFSKGGEILIPRVGEKPEDFGKCCSYLPLKDIAIGEMISVLETKQHALFYTYYFRNMYKQFAKVVEGQNVKNLYFTELEPISIHRPSVVEQQKVAECLTSVDELIVAQVRKVAALKTQKKGLMQQLFPCEGETQPRLRFREFRDAGNWEVKQLGEVADFVNEKIPLEAVALVSYVSTENILPDYGGVSRASKLPNTGSVTRYRLDDTLVSNIRPYLKKVWVADKEGGASNDVIVIRAKQWLLKKYLSCLLKNDAFIHYVMTGAKGVKMPRGDVGSMKEYPTLFPSKPEQQRIADCLTSLDDLIAAHTRKLATLKTHKNGLMQQLFPSPEDVEV